ncbi:MAG TPA: hypothetical protein DCM08_09360 [Microscillaceae bacterium]|nr:hypothetical protein [Microscillaceae bacterium]
MHRWPTLPKFTFMKPKVAILLLGCVFSVKAFAQTTQADKINVYVRCLNEAIDYANQTRACLENYHHDVMRYKKSKTPDRYALRHYTAYQCSKQIPTYYYQEAQKIGIPSLAAPLAEFWETFLRIDAQCKALEVYIRLEDYKTDQMAGSDKIMAELVELYSLLYQTKEQFSRSVRQEAASSGNGALQTALQTMRASLQREAALLDSWDYNLNQHIATAWDVDRIAQNVLENEALLRDFQAMSLPYPLDFYYKQFFLDGLQTMQDYKRQAIDQYGVGAQKTDELKNATYLALINYYNGLLVSNYNMMAEYTKNQPGTTVMESIFLQKFILASEAQRTQLSLKPFTDLPLLPCEPSAKSTAIEAKTFTTLSHYVNFINESVTFLDRFEYVASTLHDDLEDLRKGKKIQVYVKTDELKIPKSAFQKAEDETQFLENGVQESLLNQLKTLFDIEREMTELTLFLEDYAKNQGYEADNFAAADSAFERFVLLFHLADERKERLYGDVRKVFESYAAPAENHWYISAQALLQVVDAQRTNLFSVRDFHRGNAESLPVPSLLEQIKQLQRDLIVKEYDNLQGIERLGHYNGNCPYTPYEYIADDSKYLVEKTDKFSAKLPKPGTKGMYDDFYYRYNNSLVYHYNQFADLSKVPVLPYIRQPKLLLLNQKLDNPQKPFSPQVPAGEPTDFFVNMDGYALNRLTFLLDVSGSMAAADKLPLLKEAIRFMLGAMRADDKLSMVIYSGTASVVLDNASAKDTAAVHAAINGLKSGGKTDSEAGIALAYQKALQNLLADGNNRIIVATDGEFEVSKKTTNLVSKNFKKDIHFSVFVFGAGNPRNEALFGLTILGDGQYEKITKDNVHYTLFKEAKAKKANN